MQVRLSKLETEQVERNYIKEKKAAVKEFEDKKVELKENLIAELEEKKKMIENEKLTMELTGDSMEVKPIMTRKLRRRPNDPVPIPDKRRKPAPAQLNYLLTDEQIMEDLRTLNKLKSPKRPASPSSPEHLPTTPAESPAQRFEARIEDGKLYYDKRWYHKSQAIYLESKDNQKLSCVISSVGANEIWVRKTSDSTKMRIYLGQLQRGLFVIRRRWRTLWWQMENTVVDSTRHSRGSPAPPCIILSLRQLLLVVRPLRLLYSGALGVGFTDFFFFCLCFVFCFFSFKASSKFEETALSIICRSFFHGEEQEGVPSAMRFHLLNPISGSRRSLPCQAQFTASSEAWGRGPGRSHSPDSKPSWRNECLVLRLVCSIHSTG
ncbi:sin3 histone deacetylase corepressor complex component SDS3 isoform X1 [Ovis canadensis]|uniref:sin3 histone deacetylase corepressor complex component SDS3 isoform X1 n=1 Tax=Ovis canadensis TaxID=37174 RepID=UPI003751974A